MLTRSRDHHEGLLRQNVRDLENAVTPLVQGRNELELRSIIARAALELNLRLGYGNLEYKNLKRKGDECIYMYTGIVICPSRLVVIYKDKPQQEFVYDPDVTESRLFVKQSMSSINNGYKILK